MKDIKTYSGWYSTKAYDLYCEDGRVLHGTPKTGDYVTVYPYKWDRKNGGWTIGEPKLSTFLRSDVWDMK